MELAEPTWQKYGTMLVRRLMKWPGAKLEYDKRIQYAIEIGERFMRGRVRRILKALKTQATDVHPVFRQKVKNCMIPAFEMAREIRGKDYIT